MGWFRPLINGYTAPKFEKSTPFPVMGALVVISHSGVSIAMDSPVVGSRFCEKLHLAALHGHHHQSSPGGTPKTR
jgi:hypothetical protein